MTLLKELLHLANGCKFIKIILKQRNFLLSTIIRMALRASIAVVCMKYVNQKVIYHTAEKIFVVSKGVYIH